MQSGHRAETWDVEKPLAEVIAYVHRDPEDHACVRMLDPETHELWAECPVATPLHTCVEKVIDSSRYFVIRIVDSQTSKHAFIGLGFAERDTAGDFFRALIDHQHYMERKQKAESMRHDAQEESFVLNQNVTLKLNANANHHSSGGFVSSSKNTGTLNKTFSLMFQNGGLEAALSTPSSECSSPHAHTRKSSSPGDPERSPSTTTQEEWGAFESASPSS